jgi:PAS domain S-box-containing protein
MDLFSNDIKIEDLGAAIKLFHESRTGFLKLFNNSPVCMSMTTTNLGRRVYVRVNKKFLERFGYTEEETIGKTSIEIGILDEQESVRVGALIREKGRLQNDYVKCIAKSGEIVHTISSIEIMEMNDEPFLVSFFVDVTKIMEQQALIEKHALQLEAVNKELEAFSYSVSHDLRAPLRAIDGYAKILEEDFSGSFDENGRKMLAAVQRNTQRMGNLIDDLLDFARVGKKSLQRGDIDMAALVDEVLAEIKSNSSHHAEIRIASLHRIAGDYVLLKQVMTNLISNAIKYSAKKEKPLVEIMSTLEEGFAVFSVRDNGAGFDMQHAAKLFGVFQRLHKSSEFEGTGVGLAIVQRIVNKHGGTVRAEAEPGNGATFFIRMPVAGFFESDAVVTGGL